MTLTEPRYIVILTREQYFGRVAERCHISQPTLSVGVEKLEDEPGVLIFEHNKNAVHLTPVDEGIITQAQKILEQAQSIHELAQAGRNQLIAPLKTGAVYTVGPHPPPHLIPQLHRVAPQMSLYIEENFTCIPRDKLHTGELDVVIITLPFQEADILTKSLFDEPFHALVSADHLWAAKASIDSELLNDKGLLPLDEGRHFRDQVLGAYPTVCRGDENKHITVESSSLETVRHMVTFGLGISVLPFSVVDGHHYTPGVIEVRLFSMPVPLCTAVITQHANFPRLRTIGMLADSIRLCSVARLQTQEQP